MDIETIEAQIRATYGGTPVEVATNWAPTMRFEDPLVSVHGRDRIEAMFRRLGRWMAASEVVRCELIAQEETESRWALEVHYARSPRNPKMKLKSSLTVAVGSDGFTSWVEDWEAPVRAAGNPRAGWRRMLRWGLGRLSSI